MKKFDLALLSDMLFYAVAVGFFTLCLLRYLSVPLGVAFAVCALISLAVGISCYVWVGGRRLKKRLTKAQEEHKQGLMLHLALEKPERVRALLLEALQKDGREARLSEEGIDLDGTQLELHFTMQPLSADRVARLLQTHGENKFILACNDCSPEGRKLLFSFGIECWTADDIYDLFVKTEAIPEKLICGNLTKRTVKTRLLDTLKKSNARPFFVSGLLLLFMSLYAIFPTYYLTVGSILILSSVLLRLFGRRTT